MKMKLTSAACLFGIAALMAFTVKPAGKRGTNAKDPGPAWIASNYEDFQACPGQCYSVRDANPDDTIEWYVDYYNPSYPDQYLGTGTSKCWELEPGDVLTIVVTPVDSDSYEYWDTARPCED